MPVPPAIGAGQGIPRKRADLEPLGFHTLRREAVQAVQEMSADVWTDYNLHDPGVTLLEHVAFAVTDLIYRTRFPVEDSFTGPDGTIDWDRLGIHKPEAILTCRPTTPTDLRRALLDAVPEIENVWVTRAAGDVGGLYRVTLRLSPDLDEDERAAVVRSVDQAYRRMRNLGEDLAEIVVPPEIEYELEAAIDVSSDGEPATVLAHVYDACARHVAASVSFKTFEEAFHHKVPFETLFDGPFTPHGLARVDDFAASFGDDFTDLFGVVKSVPGVDQVRWLRLRRLSSIDEVSTGPARIRVPQHDGDIKIRVFKGTTELPVAALAVATTYRSLRFRQRERRRTTQDVAARTRVADGTFRDFAAYTPIQDELPAVYGVGPRGTPAAAPPDDQVRALQLKAYLYLFDQLLANFAANRANDWRLFAIDPDERSYFGQPLDDRRFAGAGALLSEPADRIVDDVLWEHYDRHRQADRRSRLFDYLLALHGESFRQFSLRQFDYYQHGDDMGRAVVRNKATLLEQVATIGRDRAAAFDDSQPSWDGGNVSGLARRVSILLGCGDGTARARTGALRDLRLEVVADAEFAARVESDVPEGDDASARRTLGHVPMLRHGVISQSILRAGSSRQRYSVVTDTDSGETFLELDVSTDPARGPQWVRLSQERTPDAGARTAHLLWQLLSRCNVASEGLDVVEHVLLRPRSSPPGPEEAAEFYSFRIRVIFPSWTTRFADPEFRKLADDTVRVNCPAHIEPAILWLDFAEMREFEGLHLAWLQERLDAGEPEQIDAASAALRDFLRARTGDR